MTVFVLERASPAVRGELTRWTLEVQTGVYVGTLNTRVRDRLWAAIRKHLGDGAAVCLHGAQNEQGFLVETAGESTRQLTDSDGLQLVRRKAIQSRRRSRGTSTA